MPTSCRRLAVEHMCRSDFIELDPLTWNDKCARGDCDGCNNIELNIAKSVHNLEITYSQWETRTQMVKKKGKMIEKNIYALYSSTTIMKDAIELLVNSLYKLRKHIYTAHQQWNAHAVLRENLDMSSTITIEDYQMNITPKFAEQPTTSGYSANKIAFALYPICIEFRGEDGTIRQGAISFLSDDMKHDHQQIQMFEKRMFQIIRDKIRPNITHWARFSDGCAAQFSSRFATADLMNACSIYKIDQAAFHYFESHEGKNKSNTIGSIVKGAFDRGLLKDKTKEVISVEDVLSVIQANV